MNQNQSPLQSVTISSLEERCFSIKLLPHVMQHTHATTPEIAHFFTLRIRGYFPLVSANYESCCINCKTSHQPKHENVKQIIHREQVWNNNSFYKVTNLSKSYRASRENRTQPLKPWKGLVLPLDHTRTYHYVFFLTSFNFKLYLFIKV